MAFLTVCTVPEKGNYTADSRFDQKYKQLLNTFKLGPATKDSVVITVKEGAEAPKEAETKETKPAEQPQQSNEAPAQETQATANDSFIRQHYSIIEAYNRLHIFNEADPAPAQPSDTNSSSDNKPAEEQPNEQPEQQKQEEPAKDNREQNKEQNKEDPNKKQTNDAAKTYRVKVSLPNEGYSIWTIVLDSSVNASKVQSALKSGSFEAAYTMAVKQAGPAGFIISKLETAISSDDEITAHAPFIGRCRYAMDSGTDKNTSEDNTICIAVAPIDGRTGKPSEKIMLKVLYSVTNMDGLTGGKLKDVAKKADAEKDKDDERSSNRDSEANDLSKWLNAKFTCVGDSESYDNFLKLRTFIKEQIQNSNIEFDPNNSESPDSYKSVSEVKKSIIAY